MKTYEDEVKEILAQRLPEHLVESVPCAFCGGERHLLRVNDRFAAYIHRGEELKKCRAVGFKTSYLMDLGKLTKETMDRHDASCEQKV